MDKKIQIIFTLLIFALMGCASTDKSAQQGVNQRVLLASKNPDALVAHYKKQLNQQATSCNRFLLAQAYFEQGDFEASLFHIGRLNDPSHEPPPPAKPIQSACTESKQSLPIQVVLLEAKTHHQLDQSEQAFILIKALEDSNNLSGEAYNLYGILLSDQAQYKQARDAFYQAREHLYDDHIVNNNLAILDIVEKRYSQAINKLIPLYTNKPKDEMVKSNLLLAMARDQRFQPFKDLLMNSYNYEEVLDLYLYLKDEQTMVNAPSLPVKQRGNNE